MEKNISTKQQRGFPERFQGLRKQKNISQADLGKLWGTTPIATKARFEDRGLLCQFLEVEKVVGQDKIVVKKTDQSIFN